MVLNTDIFKYKPVSKDLVTLVEKFAKHREVTLVEAENFIGGINTPKDLERANSG